MKAKRWMIAEPDAGGVRRLAQEMHCAPLTAAVLSARGIENAAAARAFLSCARSGLHDPFAMHDMDRAVGVIRGAIERGERIAQLAVMPVALPDMLEVETLTDTERGTGGFGSTGRQ